MNKDPNFRYYVALLLLTLLSLAVRTQNTTGPEEAKSPGPVVNGAQPSSAPVRLLSSN